MMEIMISGRGGQGVVTTGQIISRAAWLAGYNSRFMPYFGVERSGSPVFSFIRLDKGNKISTRERVNRPNVVIVHDKRLLSLSDTASKITTETDVIIDAASSWIGNTKGHTRLVDATGLAEKNGSAKMANVAMAAFFCLKILNIPYKYVSQSVKDQFQEKGKAVIEANLKISQVIYEKYGKY
jgi:2-oxoacid:acceptor oxidoreductase gamma subunit (pyruvate/2-ketoisovalerate family)